MRNDDDTTLNDLNDYDFDHSQNHAMGTHENKGSGSGLGEINPLLGGLALDQEQGLGDIEMDTLTGKNNEDNEDNEDNDDIIDLTTRNYVTLLLTLYLLL